MNNPSIVGRPLLKKGYVFWSKSTRPDKVRVKRREGVK
jgi:hypothetical protein